MCDTVPADRIALCLFSFKRTINCIDLAPFYCATLNDLFVFIIFFISEIVYSFSFHYRQDAAKRQTAGILR